MKAVIVSDRDHNTALFHRLYDEILSCLKDYEIKELLVGRGDLAYCTGCFGCWVKTPGECVMRDEISHINRAIMNSDVVFYLSPVVFGQVSANIKTVIDRGLPNMLPFFIVRPDGSTMHPPRYDQYPSQIIIGYGDDVSEEDVHLFADITKKHRRGAEAFVYNPVLGLSSQLKTITLEKSEGLL